LPRAERFEDRYRLAEAAGDAPASSDLDAWLARIATEAQEWMLRASALRALKARVSESPAYEAALDDAYPRVRVAALEALAGNPRSSTPRLIEAAESDRWPMVRAAALRALAGRDGVAGVARRALADDALLVRAAAISALTEARDRGAVPLVAERFEDDGEWPLVLEAAIEYARAMCSAELVDGLGNVVARGLRTNAWEPDVEIAAVAIQALGEIGGEQAQAFLRRAMADTAPPSLRDAARRALRATARCGR
jgi:HEAT repeat protein